VTNKRADLEAWVRLIKTRAAARYGDPEPSEPARKPERILRQCKALAPDPDSKRTLGYYRDLCVALAGEDCRAVAFLDGKIAKQGRDEMVIASDAQMVQVLGPMLIEREGKP
jgi:hypothetical protein